jgi:kynureninase
MTSFVPTAPFAADLDNKDPLRTYRSRFHIPKQSDDTDAIYFCGNSLGLQPKNARDYVLQELDDWARLGVHGHLNARHPWLPYHEFLTEQTARSIGAKPAEVVVMNTLTLNLHLMMVSFYRPNAMRHKIVIESNAFPSDRYAAASQIRFHGFDPGRSLIELKPRTGETFIRTEDIEDVIETDGESIALVLLGGVNYYSGQAFEMARIARAGHAKGCIVGFDLAHATGNLVLKLHDWDVDFAVWCSYKYLNGGPGSIGGCFVHERYGHSLDLPRFTGWWGHDKTIRFRMDPEFIAIAGAEGWQLSNPPILPLAALRASMEIFDEVGMEKLAAKSEVLTAYLEFLLDSIKSPRFAIITPRDHGQRGAQLSLRFVSDGREIHNLLTRKGVVCDWREPDVIRVAPVPLYNSFTEVYNFATILKEALS